jgi:hypothetical protein
MDLTKEMMDSHWTNLTTLTRLTPFCALPYDVSTG